MKYKVTLNGRTYEVEVEAGKAMLLDEYEAIVPTAAPAAPAAAPAPVAAPVGIRHRRAGREGRRRSGGSGSHEDGERDSGPQGLHREAGSGFQGRHR